MSKTLLGLLSGVLLLLGGSVLNINSANAVDCEDIKGETDWGSESHDDNNPSEKKFYKALEDNTFCEVVKDIDHMNIKGEIQEDTKHDWDWLITTIFFESVDEKSQNCMEDGYFDSPDDSGKDNLADYEMLECTY